MIQLNPENVIVLRVKSHVTSTLLPLNGVSKQIEDKLKTQEAELRTEKFANDLVAKLQSGTQLNAIPEAGKLAWAQTGYLGRYSTKVDSAILDLAFRLANPTSNNNNVTYGVTRIPNGYAVVSLKSVKDGVATDKKQDSIFAEQIQNSEGLLEYELYKQSQTSNADISTQQ